MALNAVLTPDSMCLCLSVFLPLKLSRQQCDPRDRLWGRSFGPDRGYGTGVKVQAEKRQRWDLSSVRAIHPFSHVYLFLNARWGLYYSLIHA